MSDYMRLFDKNAKLQEERDYYKALWEHATVTDCELRRVRAAWKEDREQNAKLRELVRYMWDFSCVVPDEPHTSKEELDYSCEVWKRMRELGVEVDG